MFTGSWLNLVLIPLFLQNSESAPANKWGEPKIEQ